MTTGVRQLIAEALETDGNERAMTQTRVSRRTIAAPNVRSSQRDPAATEAQLGSRLDRDDDVFGRNVLTRSLLVRRRAVIPKRNL
jgi:hypothetical protein